MSPPPPDDLLRHAAWVRELARALVGRDADDLVQDTWVAALRTDPDRGRSLAPWLATVARNLARNRSRAPRLESLAAGDEVGAEPAAREPAVDEVLARAELARIVVDRAMKLSDPYRRVLLLRYFDGLSAARIAACEGVPAATVRSQIKRALDQLRELLDREAGGDRRAWNAALLPLTRRAPAVGASLLAGGALLRLTGILTVAVTVAGATAWVLLGERSASPAVEVAQAGAQPSLIDPPDPHLGDAADRTRAVESDAARSPVVAPEPAGIGGPTVVGRFLADGAPAVGASAWIGCWSETLWEGTLGPDGALHHSLSFEPTATASIELRVALPGFASAEWGWRGVPETRCFDVGEVTLVRTGDVAGRVVDREGKPVRGTWTVSTMLRSAGPRRPVEVDAQTAPDGSFLLTEVPAGRVSLRAGSRIADPCEGASVEVRPGDVTTVDLVYLGAAPERRIVVTPKSPIVSIFELPAGSVRLVGGRDPITSFVRKDDMRDVLHFDDVPPGIYSVEIDDERFEPFRADGVEPGQLVRAPLVGNASLALEVFDGSRRVTDYQVEAELQHVRWFPATFWLRKSGAAHPVGGVYDRLPAGFVMSLRIDAGELGSVLLPVEALAPRESRRMRVDLSSQSLVAVRVRSGTAGTPVEGARVWTFDGPADLVYARTVGDEFFGHTSWNRSLQTPDVLAEGVTDATGRVVLEARSEGSFSVLARTSDGREVLLETAGSNGEQADGELAEVEVRLVGTGAVAGLFTGTTNGELDGVSIYLMKGETRGNVTRPAAPVPGLLARLEIRADGSFAADGVPCGTQAIVAFVPPPDATGRSGTRTGAIQRNLAVLEVLEGQTATVEVDLSETKPGWIEVLVQRDGQPLPGVDVLATLTDPALATLHTPREERNAFSGPDGIARVGPLLPGTYAVRLQGSGEVSWLDDLPDLMEIGGGDTARTRYQLELVESELEIVTKGDGGPLAFGQMRIHRVTHARHGGGITWMPKTDGGGKLIFSGVPGAYEIYSEHRNPDGEWTRVEFELGPGGATPRTITLPEPQVR